MPLEKRRNALPSSGRILLNNNNEGESMELVELPSADGKTNIKITFKNLKMNQNFRNARVQTRNSSAPQR